MRSPGRDRGRFASLSGLSIVRCGPGAPYARIVIDSNGLPLYAYTKWFALRMADVAEEDSTARSTVETYFGFLLPFAGYLHARNIAWNSSPETIRAQLQAFHQSELHLIQHKDEKLEGVLVEKGSRTPLKASSLRVMLAAWRDFYRTMRAEGLYVYPNPMESALLERLNQEHRKHVRAAGAPDHAGIRSETHAESGRRPNAFFRVKEPSGWELRQEFTDSAMLTNLARAFDAMLSTRGLLLRDEAVLLLLRYTGARVHEICSMTAGGYRSHTTNGIPGQALIINKGGHGVEDKVITFQGRPDIIETITRYVRRERARFDPQHRRRIQDLHDDESLFLTARGTPFNYDAFRNTWRHIYPCGQAHVPNGFAIHDLRHLLVTELLLQARLQHGADSQDYKEAMKSIQDLFGWASDTSITVYDHCLKKIDAIALLTALQQRSVNDPDVLVSDAVSEQPMSEATEGSQARSSPPPFAASDDELRNWIEQATG
jgi:site-specific recombinase XerD